MPCLSKYRLEAICDGKEKLFVFLESLSLVLKVAAIMLFILLFDRFYIAIAVFAISVVPAFFRKNLLYKYVYSIDENTITVTKVYNEASYRSVEVTNISDVDSFSIGAGEVRYYEVPTDAVLTIQKKNGENYSLAVDDYFVACLDHYLKNRGKV